MASAFSASSPYSHSTIRSHSNSNRAFLAKAAHAERTGLALQELSSDAILIGAGVLATRKRLAVRSIG